MKTSSGRFAHRGFSLIEVLVTLAILVVGLLGLVGLQGRAMSAQMEALQRAQALVLVQDMASRIQANNTNAAAYIATGTGTRGNGFNGSATIDCSTATTRAEADLCAWHNQLLGAGETKSGGNVGAMIGARGCVIQTSAALPTEYLVAVAWQGLASTSVSPIACGANQYGADDSLRRVIAIPITIATTL